MASNYVLIERIELNSTATSVTFNNIPQTGYTDLKVAMSALDLAEDWLEIQFNGVTTGYSNVFFRGNGVNAASSTNAWAVGGVGNLSTNIFSNCEFYIPNYSVSGVRKSIFAKWDSEQNASANYMGQSASVSTATAAIASIKILCRNTAVLQQYTTFSLYGLAATGTTPADAPKASGGNITTDGTYWIHTFLASGTFTPTQSLNCDYLVVAGGGGGGYDCGGGGGAGGLLTSLGGSTLSVSTQAYPITVGAGGFAAVSRGGNGSNSTFSSITATGGGGGGSRVSGFFTGADGGSGGGGGGDNLGAGGAASPAGQGNNGGRGLAGTTPGGGGGGANAAGTNTTSETFPGTGGSGKANTITGTSVNYSGGGGGGYNADDNGGPGGGGYGGGASSVNPGRAARAGETNKGAGGGGGSNGSAASAYGAAGGSGIVIIRYART